MAVKYKLKDRFLRLHRTTKFGGSSLGLKQGSPLTSVLPELYACSSLDALSLFDDMTISKRTLCIYKTLEITFPNGGKNLYPRRQCNIPVRFATQRILYFFLALDLRLLYTFRGVFRRIIRMRVSYVITIEKYISS